MVNIKSDFLADFNKGRNIWRNVETLKLFYKFMSETSEENQSLLQKPIIILIASIIEAVMYDFQYKAKSFTREIKKDLTSSKIELMTRHDDDEFKRLLGKFCGNNILELKGEAHALYDDIDELRLLRNRIHIQDTANSFEPEESEAFTIARRIKAEVVLEKFLKIMLERYGRGEAYRYVPDFHLPWNSHTNL